MSVNNNKEITPDGEQNAISPIFTQSYGTFLAGIKNKICGARLRASLAAGLVLGVLFGTIESFPIFCSALISDFGLERSEVSDIFSLYLLTTILIGPIAGWLNSQVSAERIICVSLTAFALAVSLCSRITALWQIYAIYIFLLAPTTMLIVVSIQVFI